MAFHVSKTSILSTLDYIEDGREDIYEWSEKRRSKRKGISGKLYEVKKLFIDKSVLRSFLQNLTIIVIFQMVLAGLNFDVNISIFVSPIVFPLAFSINADFQRRERVLEDLAEFKGALLVLFFCHRDWVQSSGLPTDFLKTVNTKLKGLVLNIKEYLLTEKLERRNYILKVVYEDLSDISQLNDKLRASSLPHNSPLITRLIHYHNLMCHSFERLRVIREYRSPRTIRSFTKVFIFIMPIVLSPYYVHMGYRSQNTWSPYFIAVLSTFIFGTLQGVQDVLDDPFDGISEDDINLGQLEDWTSHSLLTNRCITVGRFTVTTTGKELSSDSESDENPVAKPKHIQPIKAATHKRKSILRKASFRRGDQSEEISEEGDRRKTLYPETAHRLEDLARQGMTGSSTILPGMKLKRSNSDSLTVSSSRTSSTALGEDTDRVGDVRESKRVWFSNDSQGSSDDNEVPDNKDGGFEFPLTPLRNSDWTLDENLPLISQDSSSCSGTATSSVIDPTELPEDLCKELNSCSGTSLIKGRFSVNKPKGDVPPSLANLFNNQPSSEPPHATGGRDTSNSNQGQSDSVPSSLRNIFAPPENSDNTGHFPGNVSSSVKTPSCSSPSSSQCPDFSFPESRIHSPTSPNQVRKRDSLRKLSGQPSSSLEDAESLSSRRSPGYLVRKKSASLRVTANGNSRTALPSSAPKSDKKMSRFAIEPSPHSQEVSSSTEPLTFESLGVLKATGDKMDDLDSAAEKEGRSKLVGSPNARFTLAKPSDHVNSSQKENQPLTKTEVPNYGVTDSPPPPSVESFPPSRLQRKSSRESSQDTAPEEPVAKVASDNDSCGRLSIGGESAEVYI
ncbi:uncharacterized protein LOC122960251 isoform X2 [Acropora millepora]|uniref:uncharacterized protein LOC122960251 isoform X2 n=1 Tax=Acropora millepora TaxID=45264 RepID=UPI001CF11409|nr:uncharacterized protein LOC122960251 isoform X2 [Acropora millepora]